MAQQAERKILRKKKNKASRAYSRAGEGDDERAFAQWNEKWVKKFWADFLKEIERGKN